MKSERLKTLDLINFAVTLAAAGVGFAAFSPGVGLGLTAGTLLMSVNFFVLRRLTSHLLTGRPKKMAIAMLWLVLKLGLFFTAVWLCMTYLPINVLAFGIGAGLILLAVTLTASLSNAASVDAS